MDKEEIAREIVDLLKKCFGTESVVYLTGITHHLNVQYEEYAEYPRIDDFEHTVWSVAVEKGAAILSKEQGSHITVFSTSSDKLQDVLDDVRSEARRRKVAC